MIRRPFCLVLSLCSLALMAGCGNNTPEESAGKPDTVIADTAYVQDAGSTGTPDDTGPHSFAQYIALFKPVTLPLEFHASEAEVSFLKSADERDTAFTKNLPCLCYAVLPDTGTFYAVITIVQADELIPQLITYDKKGKRISSKVLALIGTSGFLCGSSSKQQYKIGTDLSILCTDSVTANICDQLSGQPASSETYNKTIRGKIQTDGKIVTEEKGNFPW